MKAITVFGQDLIITRWVVLVFGGVVALYAGIIYFLSGWQLVAALANPAMLPWAVLLLPNTF